METPPPMLYRIILERNIQNNFNKDAELLIPYPEVWINTVIHIISSTHLSTWNAYANTKCPDKHTRIDTIIIDLKLNIINTSTKSLNLTTKQYMNNYIQTVNSSYTIHQYNSANGKKII